MLRAVWLCKRCSRGRVGGCNGEVSLGVLAKNVELDEGEVMLSSKGGASIVLKNDGRVLINGKAV